MTALAQNVTSFEEHRKLILAPHAIATVGTDLFGDSVNFYQGELSFTQTDVSLAGNDTLPVMIGRRIKTGERVESGKSFGRWELDIPHLYGIFSRLDGWKASDGSAARCSRFGAPPMAVGNNGESFWESDEFWRGSYLYVPGAGDQRLLLRDADNLNVPSPAHSYPVVTKDFWAITCLPTLKNASTATVPPLQGEGFLAIAPDGTKYHFDWMVRYPTRILMKSTGAPQGAASVRSKPLHQQGVAVPLSLDNVQAGTGNTVMSAHTPVEMPDMAVGNPTLARDEVWILPTKVEDRHGNTITYTYDPQKPRNLMRIDASDGRSLVLTYATAANGSDQVVKTVTDGVRTWTYEYHGENNSSMSFNLDKVILPDRSSWNFSGFDELLNSVTLQSNGGCYDRPLYNPRELTGNMVHPSGATGTFTLRPTLHGRSHVQPGCFSVDTPPVVPRFFVAQSMIGKTISGPGLGALAWTIEYGTPNESWDDCESCPDVKTVSVTDPARYVTRYTFGNRHHHNEGRIELKEIGWDGYSALQTTALTYRAVDTSNPYPAFVGVGDPGNSGDSYMDSRLAPLEQRTITQQGATFVWNATDFDAFAKPVSVTRSSSLGHARAERITYENNVAKWVLGRVKQVTEAGSGKVMVSNGYNGATANLESTSRFGKLEQTIAYNADGTVKSVTDGKNQATKYSNYRRGIAQRIDYADGSFEAAVVNGIGKITSLTSEAQATTIFDYDAMGRLASITHPTGDTVAWNGVKLAFAQVAQQEYDLAPGHWKQTITNGNATEVRYFDALWRPVYSERWDAADRAGTVRLARQSHDFDGRVTFASYPRRSQSELVAGTTSRYDALGRPTESIVTSERGDLVTRTTYDAGLSTTVTDARGNATSYHYQAFDDPAERAITSITLPAGISVAIARDVFGKPSSIQRHGGNRSVTRSYVYDTHERLCKTTEPETGATFQSYDAANNVLWRANGTDLSSAAACDLASVPASRKTSHVYDLRNRLTGTTFGDGSPGIDRTWTPDGLPATVNSGRARWSYTYNKRRLLEREALVYGATPYNVDRTYDANGSLATLKYPGDVQPIAYSPNALGEARTVGAYATAISYHPNGAIARFQYGNGIVHTMEQNVRGLPNTAVDAGVLKDIYSYDENGNVLGIQDGQEGIASRSMTYDTLDRLETVSAPGLWGVATYGYDAQDNLVSTTLTGGANSRRTTHAIDTATNRIGAISSSNAAFNIAYGYDVQGNITRRGSRNYVFDIANRMSGATGLSTYEYDGHGRRVSVVGNDGVNRLQVYSQDGRLLYTTAGAGSATKYIYLNNHVIAEVK